MRVNCRKAWRASRDWDFLPASRETGKVRGHDKDRDHEVRHGVGSSRSSRGGCGSGGRVRYDRRYDVSFGDLGLNETCNNNVRRAVR